MNKTDPSKPNYIPFTLARTKPINVRLTPEEYNELRMRHANSGIKLWSDWVRLALFEFKGKPVKETK